MGWSKVVLDQHTLVYQYFVKNHVTNSEETFRSSHPEMFLGKGVLKTCSKFTGDHPC